MVREDDRRKNRKQEGKHVLIMALSTFPWANDVKFGDEVRKATIMKKTKYLFKDFPQKPIPDESGSTPVDGNTGALPDISSSSSQDGNKESLKKSGKDQLEYEGFTHDEAIYGTDNCGADWNDQAVKKANSYLEITAFSKSGLIDQLVFDGFTKTQAEYAASEVGY